MLHAPGSLCTYEPQFASDVYAMYQSVLFGHHTVTEDLLWKNTPKEEIGNFDYLVDVIDWEKNVDPEFHSHRFMAAKTRASRGRNGKGWLYRGMDCYKCPTVSREA